MSNPQKVRKSGQGKRIELLVEKLMWRFRLVAMIPVVMSLVSTLVTFVLGTKSILNSFFALHQLEGIGDHWDHMEAELLAGIVSGIDLYLIGIALLIFGYGMYELLLSSIDAAHESPDGVSDGLLDIRNLDQLKEKLVKVLVVALIVTAFKFMLMMKVEDGKSLILFCVSVLLLALSGYLVTGHGHKKDHA